MKTKRKEASLVDEYLSKIRYTPELQIKGCGGAYFYRIKDTIFIHREGYVTEAEACCAMWELRQSAFPTCHFVVTGAQLETEESPLGPAFPV